MARHRGLQLQNRIRALGDVLWRRAMELGDSRSEVQRAEEVLEALRATRDKRILELKEAEALQQNLINAITTKGLWPWGLPEGITLKQWLSIVKEDWQGQSEDIVAENKRLESAAGQS